MGDDPGSEREPEGQEPRVPDVLRGRTTREILARLIDGDPLELRPRCRERLRERAHLIALGRVVSKVLARTARSALDYAGVPPLAEWLRNHVDRAIDDALDEDLEGTADERSYDFVTQVWEVEAELGRKICVLFNGLPDPVRAVYQAVVVDGKTINRWVAEGHGPPKLARERLRRAVQALATLLDPGEFDFGQEHDRDP